ncbi:MAG TPA: glycoside hydrolase family 25 protein [Candidatus Acetatifactor stercoripullorum]|uniref:Glycoside hydrolase family 25 protein n=1 Tax=Candidatus Acetatifactor stercoripullorum TaxID=2838414 RepID=A0A9D1UAV6_9FIRM|nr:glycoside hydrolase family 25 protein [uncultured Acetatifactor sp.]HIW81042.1 glycoside hydrolase family 25 protein [Candidatus Acetatifactor stercoripullorum]
MKNNRNGSRTTEDRLERSGRRRNNRISSILVMFGCLLVLVLVTYLAGVLYMWIDAEFQKNADDIAEAVMLSEQEGQVTYTQEELDAMVAQAKEEAGTEASQEILEGIKASLTAGETTVETLRPYYPDELVVVSGGTFHFVPIQKDLRLNDYTQENLNILETGEYQYLENGQVTSHKGIDVSKHQGEIDWQQVAADGVEYAFIRVGLRGYGTGKLVEDEYFEQNITGALSAGIKVGVYFYTQAINEEELMEEANFVLEKIAPYRIECPVVFDVEKVSGDDGRMNSLTVEERTNLTLLFCQTIENAGYKPMIYHNMEMGALLLDLAKLENYDKWFAYYNADFYYPYQYEIWQYTDNGTVNGIDGPVDLNISFGPLW